MKTFIQLTGFLLLSLIVQSLASVPRAARFIFGMLVTIFKILENTCESFANHIVEQTLAKYRKQNERGEKK